MNTYIVIRFSEGEISDIRAFESEPRAYELFRELLVETLVDRLAYDPDLQEEILGGFHENLPALRDAVSSKDIHTLAAAIEKADAQDDAPAILSVPIE